MLIVCPIYYTILAAPLYWLLEYSLNKEDESLVVQYTYTLRVDLKREQKWG